MKRFPKQLLSLIVAMFLLFPSLVYAQSSNELIDTYINRINDINAQLEEANNEVNYAKKMLDDYNNSEEKMMPAALYEYNYSDAIEKRDIVAGELSDLKAELNSILPDFEKTVIGSSSNADLYKKLANIYKLLDMKEIKVFVNGNKLVFDVQPFSENGRTLVPIRAITEALGAEVKWNGETKTAVLTKGSTAIQVTIGNIIAVINDKSAALEVPPKSVNGKTFVPLRFISESFNAQVSYNGDARVITINSK